MGADRPCSSCTRSARDTFQSLGTPGCSRTRCRGACRGFGASTFPARPLQGTQRGPRGRFEARRRARRRAVRYAEMWPEKCPLPAKSLDGAAATRWRGPRRGRRRPSSLQLKGYFRTSKAQQWNQSYSPSASAARRRSGAARAGLGPGRSCCVAAAKGARGGEGGGRALTARIARHR